MSTVASVETLEVDALTEQHNYAVIRLPERKVPGVVVEGDSLSTLVADLRGALDYLREGAIDDGIADVADVLETLEGAKRPCEAALAAHSMSLP